jgi:ATP-dependent RNA helicase DDX19/DBP5
MSAPNPSGSLADRVTKPLDGSTDKFTPAASKVVSTSWADELASPVETPSKGGPSLGGAQADRAENDQTDGASEPQGGSGLHDAQYEVEVKLSDIQGDSSSPLFSIASFEQLGM